VSEQLLTLLKLSLLAFLYLFLFRVVRAVWAELSPPSMAGSVVDGGRRRGRRPKVARHGGVPPSGPGRVAAGAAAAPAAPPVAAPPSAPTKADRKAAKRGGKPAPVGQLVILEPVDRAGQTFVPADETTVGRAPGCGITVDDTYASQLHARIFRTGEGLFVEDLGSTNGTFLNQRKVGGPQPLHAGDRLQIGNTVLEAR